MGVINTRIGVKDGSRNILFGNGLVVTLMGLVLRHDHLFSAERLGDNAGLHAHAEGALADLALPCQLGTDSGVGVKADSLKLGFGAHAKALLQQLVRHIGTKIECHGRMLEVHPLHAASHIEPDGTQLTGDSRVIIALSHPEVGKSGIYLCLNAKRRDGAQHCRGQQVTYVVKQFFHHSK